MANFSRKGGKGSKGAGKKGVKKDFQKSAKGGGKKGAALKCWTCGSIFHKADQCPDAPKASGH